ncbi:MAG TPA: SIS domain-containing protein [Solirubrobacteraceae bacterium]|nr:SIS domain-containing protein [Solirubrobacteraceae bacterium]
MATTIRTQPDELRRLLGDPGSAQAAAQRIADRRTWLVGIGTSWHAAHHGAWLLHEAGHDAFALHAADVAPYARRFDPADAVIVLSHTGHTGYTAQALGAAREAGAAVVYVTAIGAGGDVETVAPETSYAYTASHTGALMRLAQIAEALGAELGDLAAVPDVVARTLEAPAPIVEPPDRLLELIGAGPNAWTAQEGALKIREASYVATEGLSSEQFLHGPSVALDRQDTLVVLDGGGPGAARTAAIAGAMEVTGARVVRLAERDLGEALSIFPLTVWVQRIALELAQARGVSPDRFRYEEDPRREQAIEALGF